MKLLQCRELHDQVSQKGVLLWVGAGFRKEQLVSPLIYANCVIL